jgi:hypothetical protein
MLVCLKSAELFYEPSVVTPGGEGRSSIVNLSRRGTLFVSVARGGSGRGIPLLADCAARP